jgi:aminopeptidase N
LPTFSPVFPPRSLRRIFSLRSIHHHTPKTFIEKEGSFMSTIESIVPAVEVPTSHPQEAQARLLELRQMREKIPHFVIPLSPAEVRRLIPAATVPPEFVALTTVAIANENALVRGDGATPAEIRDLTSYADSYEPVADELEALAQFIRHSARAARNKAGSEALTTYSLSQRLAKRPEHAHLAPYVADMRRALKRVRKLSPEEKAERAVKQAEKRAAKQAAALTTVQPS